MTVDKITCYSCKCNRFLDLTFQINDYLTPSTNYVFSKNGEEFTYITYNYLSHALNTLKDINNEIYLGTDYITSLHITIEDSETSIVISDVVHFTNKFYQEAFIKINELFHHSIYKNDKIKSLVLRTRFIESEKDIEEGF